MILAWEATIFAPSLAVFASLATWFVSTKYEAIRRQRERLHGERRRLYIEILEPLLNILTPHSSVVNSSDASKSEAIQKLVSPEYKKTSFELNLLGSDDVVRSQNDLMQYYCSVERGEDNGKPDYEKVMRLLGNLLLNIRRDLGNGRTKLDEIDMLEAFFTDIRELRKREAIASLPPSAWLSRIATLNSRSAKSR